MSWRRQRERIDVVVTMLSQDDGSAIRGQPEGARGRPEGYIQYFLFVTIGDMNAEDFVGGGGIIKILRVGRPNWIHRGGRQLSSFAGFEVNEKQPLADSISGSQLVAVGRPERIS